ncbi:MAG: 50S ribosomal protein L10 [Bacteroidia bacterium]|nr:50S ribosomal protein L10 [Bacteroidota bacterium]MBP9081748.1 50S ribosomal protein L10 [Bacteroidia bacterium]MBK7389446.1 50S ribosomal protein L10 [Bacteroidota bacterium]MBK7970476.1 50S ribosomal protein L10 [Bacteroidota bacterium]MBK8414513.1 50S ribosomal protein L10 [Bacteroidota bacterium]
MKREEKDQIIGSLVEDLSKYNCFYITDISSLTVEKTNQLRRLCFNKQVKINVAKNSMIKKALERMDGDYSPLFETLKGSSAIMYSDTGNVPAKLIKEFRAKNDRPILKGAWIDSAIFVGDNNLDVLVALKSKNELVADVIALLQSPAKNVISALQSSGQKLAGILKTLEEKGS